MQRTTIMLPPLLKTRALHESKKMGLSLEEFIREAMERHLKDKEMGRGEEFENDPFLGDTSVFKGASPADLSVNHDVYLCRD